MEGAGMRRKKVLFIQLPHLDNDVVGVNENVQLASAYLTWSAKRAGLAGMHSFMTTDPAFDLLDDHNAVNCIVSRMPDILAATLYAWNVERTLWILRQVRKRCSGISILIGGPEVARNHPSLFRADPPFDAAVSGEGELIFPDLLRYLSGGPKPAFRSVALPGRGGFEWGTKPLPVSQLPDLLPPPGFMACGPDKNGIAYMETSRGCPLHCMFCCYNQRRRGVSFLGAAEVERRVRALRKQGAAEIRLVDPTFNSNPDFNNILKRLSVLNRNRDMLFFAEVRAETITPEHARLLRSANFAALEVGVQSMDKRVLSAIRRPTNLERLAQGIRDLSRRRIHLTVDIMSGLPGQTFADVRRSLRWASRIFPGRLQFMHTLLLPGTELRNKRHSLGLHAQRLPPYRVESTQSLSAAGMRDAELLAFQYTGAAPDCLTRVFVGHRLPDLFGEQIRVLASSISDCDLTAGRQARKSLIITGSDLYAERRNILRLLYRAVHSEPRALWQFVLAPEREEPLDLLDQMIEQLRLAPAHFLDRLTVMPREGMLASRRIFIQLKSGHRFSRDWQSQAEELLRTIFY
jgi:hypothetical protein